MKCCPVDPRLALLLLAALVACSDRDMTSSPDASFEGEDASIDGPALPDSTCSAVEECNGIDDDCDGVVDEAEASNACGSGLLCWEGTCASRVHRLWDRIFGGTGVDSAASVAVDGEGNVYVTGEFQRDVDFGGGTATLGATNLFLVSLSADGTYRWDRTFGGGASVVRPEAMAIDPDGNLIIAGSYSSSVDFGGGLLESNASDLFVVSFASDGTYRWHFTSFDALGDQRPQALAVEANRIYVTGSYSAEVEFAEGANGRCWGMECYFTLALDGLGAYRWVMSSPGTVGSRSGGRDVAIDPATGDIFVVGAFEGADNLGIATRASVGLEDAFMQRLGSNGDLRWKKIWGGMGRDTADAVAVTGEGETLTVGAHTDTDLGSGSNTSGLYLLSTGRDGDYLWDWNFDTTTTHHHVHEEPDGGVIVVGRATSAYGFGSGVRSGGIFVLSLDSTRRNRWDYAIGGHTENVILGTALTSDGSLLLAGRFEDTLEFDPESRSSAGQSDAFVALVAER